MSPLDFLKAAEIWAGGGLPPTLELESALVKTARPILDDPAHAREPMWGILSYPERARALAWLSRTNLLEEILPVWKGSVYRQRYRLLCVEELHLERWAEGLSQAVFQKLCEEMGTVLDDGINRWALTGLGILLAEGDVNSTAHANSVKSDLNTLGASSAETELILTIVREYPIVMRALNGKKSFERKFSAPVVLCGLASLFADSYSTLEDRQSAVSIADNLLEKIL